MSREFTEFGYDCEKQGCFNEKHRLNFRFYKDLLPGRISFSDIDGIVEIDGKALMLEMKSTPIDWRARGNVGQRIMFERLTEGKKISVLCMAGTEQGMIVTHYGKFFDGKWIGWKEGTIWDVRTSILKWLRWVKGYK